MSARSMIRSRERRLARARRRRVAMLSVAASGAAAALAPAAQAASFQVNSLGDGPASACDATCTLRDAVLAANIDAGPDTVSFNPSMAGQIRLTAGQIPIQAALAIEGPGADVISVSGDANGDNVHNAGDSRIFSISPDAVGAQNDPVSISGLTLTEGTAMGGGAIRADYASLTIADARVFDNESTSGGGGVFSGYGPLTVSGSTFSSNAAPAGGGEGGAILTAGGTGADTDGDLVITGSTFSGNAAGAEGGAVYFGEGSDSARIERSTFNGNQAGALGGGIFVEGPDVGMGPVTIEDTTVSGNTSGNDGGGISIYNYGDGEVTVRNSTVAGNGAVDSGGGIFRSGLEITVPGTDNVGLSSTIVAGNVAGSGPDLGEGAAATGAFIGGFNLIGDPAGGATIQAVPAGSNLFDLDPQLGSLTDNGGPTRTMLPASSSPAIDAGTANGLASDQRGLGRTIAQPAAPDAAGGDGTDVGAVELPDIELSGAQVKAKRKQKQTGQQIKVRLTAEADEAVTVTAQGKVKAKGKRFVLQKIGQATTAGRRARIIMNPKQGRASRQINKLLDRRRKVSAKLKVTLTDEFGNEARERASVRLK